nr:zinc finger, CCHC-type [Tanacetum cinerariifolium]
MDSAAMKHMASKFAKLDKFKGVDFRRWQKKMHFLLSSMSVVYVLTTLIPDEGDDAIVDQIKKGPSGTMMNLHADKITKKPFQNVKHETEVLELIYSNLCDLHATPSLGNKKYFVTFIDDASRVPNKRNKIALYELWTKRKPNLNYLRVWGYRAVERLPDPKIKTLGERGIECIFVGYAEHSKAFRFYVIEPNDSVLINFIIESRDAIFDENRFSLVPRPSLRIPKGTKDIGGSVVPKVVTDEDVAFWKEVINDEMDSIMGNNTWVLADLPPACKPLGCKWIFKRKLKVDGTIEKFKARLVIQGFKQKSGIDYFNTYALVVDMTKEFLSSRLSMKDIGEANVILGIRIKHKSNGVAISQSYYIEKVPKKFNYFDCTPVSTPMDTIEKLMPNNGQAVSQLEYFRMIGCLMYAMTCTRLDIDFVVVLPGGKNCARKRVVRTSKAEMDPMGFYACSDSLLLTPLCCDDIHEVTLRVSALAGCDRLDKILATLGEVSKVENVTAEMLHGMDQLIEKKEDRGMKFIWVPLIDDAEIRESSLTGSEMVQEKNDKVVLIKEKLKAARDHQKSYIGNMRKHLEWKLVIK